LTTYADEQGPDTRPHVDPPAKLAQVPRSWLELAEHDFAEDWDAVAPIQGDGGYVENTEDGGVRAEADEVNRDTPKDADPDRENGSAGHRQDFCPDVRERNETIAREREDGASEGLHGREGDELDDEEGAKREDNATRLSENVEEYLGDGLCDPGPKNFVNVSHDETEDNGEEPADDVSEQHGHADGPWCLDLRFDDLLCDMSSGVVVGHRPADGQKAEEE